MPSFNHKDRQGGKAFGEYMVKWEKSLDEINQGFEEDYKEEFDDITERLAMYKEQFIDCDQDLSGDLNVMDVKYMLEKLGQAKTHLEVMKMIREVDSTDQDAIGYSDFLRMMLGKKNSILKKILMFEALAKPKEQPTGVAPKRDLGSLP